MAIIRDYTRMAEEEFNRRGYANIELRRRCVREANDVSFLDTEEEFITYATALYEAQRWADKIDGVNTDEEKCMTAVELLKSRVLWFNR